MHRLWSYLVEHANAVLVVIALYAALNLIVDIASGRFTLASAVAALFMIDVGVVVTAGTYLYLRRTRGIQR
jgi:hypothetical protein